MCCGKNIRMQSNQPLNGAASLAPSGNPVISPQYSTQAAQCDGSTGAIVSNAPYLITPDDYASLAPIVSVPVIDRRGRVDPNNQYIFTPSPSGVIQVQSPKVGRY